MKCMHVQYGDYIVMMISISPPKTPYDHRTGERHVTRPALGPGRVFVWVTRLALPPVSPGINPDGFTKRLHISRYR